jgi:hypothetical protein
VACPNYGILILVFGKIIAELKTVLAVKVKEPGKECYGGVHWYYVKKF